MLVQGRRQGLWGTVGDGRVRVRTAGDDGGPEGKGEDGRGR